MNNHLASLLLGRAASGDDIFLTTPAGQRLTYGEVKKASARYANALVSLGVKPGDRVAAQVEKSPEALLLYLGCVRAGAVFLPLNTAYTVTELEYFLGDATPALVVCDPARSEALREIAVKAGAQAVETLDARSQGSLAGKAGEQSTSFANIPRGPDDLAAILYTSGTTGRSKGAMLSHDNLASNALTLAQAWRFTASDVLLHALPIYHTHGLFVATNIMLVTGGSMIFMAKFDADEVMRWMPRATSMMGVPTFYTRLLQHPGLTRAATAHIRLFVSGSAPLLADTHRDWREKTGHAILERYGMTETNMITSNPFDGARVAGTVGLPLDGVAVRVADPETGRHLATDEIGVIEVKGPNVFKGYWKNPEKTVAEFRPDGFFITGDLGKRDAQGYYHIVGRGKDLIITGGFNVYPKEVENEIDALHGVVESAVIGVPHRDFGEAVVAVVVGDAALDVKAMLAALDGRLAKFKLPKKIVVVAELPRNPMGKVQKNVLRETYKGVLGQESANGK